MGREKGGSIIPFLDLAQYERIQEEIQAAVRASFASTEFAQGKEVAAFEEEFAPCSIAVAVALMVPPCSF